MSSREGHQLHPDNAYKPNLIPLVVILGPTAVGKSDIAIQLAEKFNGEIVSADSRLFYRGMDIGTAKPSLADRSRVPHHLIDVANPDEIWSLGLYQKEAHKVILEIYQRQHLPFLVGGTGQFIRSIIEGWSPPVVGPNPHMRRVLSEWAEEIGSVELHSRLATLDPQAANTIDPSNQRRVIRALEVILSTGKRFSDQRRHGRILYNPLLLGLTCPRSQLYRRIDERIIKMIQDGFVEEVQELLDRGYSPDLPTLSAIGYGEIIAYIQGKYNLDEAIRSMKKRTRIFVRRQANWFKESDPAIHWSHVDGSILNRMGALIENWLAGIDWNEDRDMVSK